MSDESKQPKQDWEGKFRERLEKRKELELILFTNVKKEAKALRELLDEVNGHWVLDDGIYRFYHQSFKVYYLQSSTEGIVESLKKLIPGEPLNDWFMKIIGEGTGKVFEMEHNKRWLEVTRPIVEAFFHARYFLEMAVKSGQDLKDEKEPPQMLPSGWAALLYLYNIR